MLKTAKTKENPLDGWRVTGDSAYAPNPLAVGLCLIAEGLKLIGSDLARMPRRAFFKLQHWLVFQWTGMYNYPRSMAVYAWVLSFMVVFLYGIVALLLGSISNWVFF
jgi:hypothetical protein